jgi:hypothetical protein
MTKSRTGDEDLCQKRAEREKRREREGRKRKCRFEKKIPKFTRFQQVAVHKEVDFIRCQTHSLDEEGGEARHNFPPKKELAKRQKKTRNTKEKR